MSAFSILSVASFTIFPFYLFITKMLCSSSLTHFLSLGSSKMSSQLMSTPKFCIVLPPFLQVPGIMYSFTYAWRWDRECDNCWLNLRGKDRDVKYYIYSPAIDCWSQIQIATPLLKQLRLLN